jgi:CO/xanthine dehydrogenase FAD-binding subunit
MPTRIRQFHRPADRAEAVKRLRQGAVPLMLSPRAAPLEAMEAEAVLDLSRLNLSYVLEREGRIHIGSQTPLQALVESPLIQALAGGILSQAAMLAAGLGMRNVASVAGALVAGDGPPEVHLALLALDANAILLGEETRPSPLSDLDLSLAGSLADVSVAIDQRAAGSLQRVARTPRDRAIVAAAAVLGRQGGQCTYARLAVAGASSAPVRIRQAEQLLEGSDYSEVHLGPVVAAAASTPNSPSDYRGSAAYRQAMAARLARRALHEAWQAAAT